VLALALALLDGAEEDEPLLDDEDDDDAGATALTGEAGTAFNATFFTLLPPPQSQNSLTSFLASSDSEWYPPKVVGCTPGEQRKHLNCR
jgi:hypothetical protein